MAVSVFSSTSDSRVAKTGSASEVFVIGVYPRVDDVNVNALSGTRRVIVGVSEVVRVGVGWKCAWVRYSLETPRCSALSCASSKYTVFGYVLDVGVGCDSVKR